MPYMTGVDKQRAKSELADACLSAVRNYLGTTRGAALMGANAKATSTNSSSTIVIVAEGGCAFKVTVSEFNG